MYGIDDGGVDVMSCTICYGNVLHNIVMILIDANQIMDRCTFIWEPEWEHHFNAFFGGLT